MIVLLKNNKAKWREKDRKKKKTLAYFPKNSIYQHREFVEDIGHKYIVQEQHIRKMLTLE